MKYYRTVLMLTLLLLGGCAAYTVPALTAGHPANPDALTAPEPPRSQTLAYSRPETSSPAARSDSSAAARSKHESHHKSEATAPGTATGEGKIVATVPSANQIVIEHGEIKGFMDAMTMGYQIDPPSLLQGLKPGDSIRFTIDVQRKIIVKIEKLGK